MAEDNFVDYVRIYFTSGAGGPGVVHWRREKHVPHGGPDGGDGGPGGSIYLRGNRHRWTLLDLKYRKYIKAEAGAPGEGGRRSGGAGQDIVLDVPLGTLARDADTEELIGEVTQDGQRLLLVPGGRGGLGNWHFRTSTNQTPEKAIRGGPAQERTVVLELKLLADVGLVGQPNAGKSTLLGALSAATPPVADYPFTTLTPNLGMVRVETGTSFVMADLPGIIAGAAEGRGLGLRFLRHIERNSLLLLVLPVTEPHWPAALHMLLHELQQYDPELMNKPRMVGLSKADLLTPDQAPMAQQWQAQGHEGMPVVLFSAVTGQGLPQLTHVLWQQLQLADTAPEAVLPTPEL